MFETISVLLDISPLDLISRVIKLSQSIFISVFDNGCIVFVFNALDTDRSFETTLLKIALFVSKSKLFICFCSFGLLVLNSLLSNLFVSDVFIVVIDPFVVDLNVSNVVLSNFSFTDVLIKFNDDSVDCLNDDKLIELSDILLDKSLFNVVKELSTLDLNVEMFNPLTSRSLHVIPLLKVAFPLNLADPLNKLLPFTLKSFVSTCESINKVFE